MKLHISMPLGATFYGTQHRLKLNVGDRLDDQTRMKPRGSKMLGDRGMLRPELREKTVSRLT